MSWKTATLAACMLVFSASAIGADEEAREPDGIYSGATFSRSSLSSVWKLEEEEIALYEQLEIEERVYSDPGTVQSPYAVLGKHARTTAEREKYARMEKQKMEEHTIKAILWVMAHESVAGYRETSPAAANAQKALEIYDSYPEIQDVFAQEGIGRSSFVNALHASYGMNGDQNAANSEVANRERVVFFANIDDCGDGSICLSKLKSMQSKQVVGGVEMIDVVAIGSDGDSPSDQQVVEWANANRVVTKQTINKSITLQSINEDSEALLSGRKAPIGVLLDGTVYQ